MRKYRAGEVAELLGVSVRTLHRMTDDGKIKATRMSNGYRAYSHVDVMKALPNGVDAPPTDLITGEEACTILGIARETLRRWEKAGKVVSVRQSGRKLFHQESINAVARADRKS